MAKRMSAGLSWRRLGIVRVTWLTCVVIVVLGAGTALGASDSVLSNSPSSNAVVASLAYQETDYSVVNWGVSVTVQSAPFKKEPAAAAGKNIRGVLNFSGGSSNSIPFLWQRDAGKLYLDLNGNRDLTDDPTGVYAARVARPVSYQTFTNVRLLFNTASGRCPVLADISLYEFRIAANVHLCGALVLARQSDVARAGLAGGHRPKWLEPVRLVGEQPVAAASVGKTKPAVQRRRRFAGQRSLFAEGFCGWPGLSTGGDHPSQDGEATLSLQFTEQSVPLGEVNVTGQFISRLVLMGWPYSVILDQPAGVVRDSGRQL